MENEQRIRNKTEELFRAYIELTGNDETPTISDFLLLREASIAELKSRPQGLSGSRDIEAERKDFWSLTQLEKKQTGRQPAVLDAMGEERTKDSAAKQDAGRKKPEARPEPLRSQIVTTNGERSQKRTEKTPKSAFEILRSIGDPWN